MAWLATVTIQVVDFNDLVIFGKTHGANTVNGMPWSFQFYGRPITHETDTCYLIPTSEKMVHFELGDVIAIMPNNEMAIYKKNEIPAYLHYTMVK